uniref:Ephrin RBD domain-containing protein n=1 Tax=Labrus bergylta TaxID=56723 RepID=A0A3Q3FBV5_9LABR
MKKVCLFAVQVTDPHLCLLRREGFTVQVSVNDYLDIYCPHYNISQRGTLERTVAEQYILYMVSYRGYRACDPQLGFKRWECNRPHAPHAPIKFSEKFQRYSAFSLGYEFNVGQEYYYISTPTHHHGHNCLRLRVYVCCSTGETPTTTISHSLVYLSVSLHLHFPPPTRISLCIAPKLTNKEAERHRQERQKHYKI